MPTNACAPVSVRVARAAASAAQYKQADAILVFCQGLCQVAMALACTTVPSGSNSMMACMRLMALIRAETYAQLPASSCVSEVGSSAEEMVFTGVSMCYRVMSQFCVIGNG